MVVVRRKRETLETRRIMRDELEPQSIADNRDSRRKRGADGNGVYGEASVNVRPEEGRKETLAIWEDKATNHTAALSTEKAPPVGDGERMKQDSLPPENRAQKRSPAYIQETCHAARMTDISGRAKACIPR